MDQDIQDLAGSDGVSIHSGFPNPALDRRGQGPQLTLDLNRLLVRHPSSTFLFRIKGHLWVDQGVYDGDVAVIDRAVAARANDLVISRGDDGFQLYRQSQYTADEAPWGVVTAIIHQYERP